MKKREDWVLDLAILWSYGWITFFLLPTLFTQSYYALPDLGDSLHNIWIYGDNINRIEQHRVGLFNGNIFYPELNTATFSEFQLINTIIFYPFFRLLNNPILGYNFILILSFTLSPFYTYKITYLFTHRRYISFMSGIIFGFFSYKFSHLAHVQLLSFQWVIIPLFYIINFFEKGKKIDFLLFSLCFVFQSVSIGYNTVYLYTIILTYIAFRWIFYKRNILDIKVSQKILVLIYLGLNSLICLPFYIPYIQSSINGYNRGLKEIESYGLDILLLLSSSCSNFLYSGITESLKAFRPDGCISSVFPGITVTLLLFLSLFKFATKILFKYREIKNFKYSFNALYCLILIFLFFVLILGPSIKVYDRIVFPNYIQQFLFYTFPIFRAIRYIPNYIMPLMFFVSIFVSLQLSEYCDKAKPKTQKFKEIIVLIFCILIVFEYRTNSIQFREIPYGSNIPSVYKWLKIQPRSPIIELPLPSKIDNSEASYLAQFLYMYYSIYHGMPMVNGISGFFPESYLKTVNIAKTFPSLGSLIKLQEMGVNYVVLHKDEMNYYDKMIDIIKSNYKNISLQYQDMENTVLSIEPSLDLNKDISKIKSNSSDSDAPSSLFQYELKQIHYPKFIYRGEELSIETILSNSGNAVWLADTNYQSPPGKGEVRLRIESFKNIDSAQSSEDSPLLDARARLPYDVFPGDEVRVELCIPTENLLPGKYNISLNLVNELKYSFSQKPTQLEIVVNQNKSVLK